MPSIDLFRSPPTRHPRFSAPTAYGLALMATSISTFAYLFALQRIIANNSNSGLESLVPMFWLAGLAAPLVVAAKGCVLATILWSALALFDVSVRFERCLAVAWSSEVLLAAPQFVYGVVGLLRGATERGDLYLPLGLDLIWQPTQLPLGILSHSMSIFFVAWIVFVWTRLRRQTAAGSRSWPITIGTLVAAAIIVILPIVQLTP